MARGSKNAEPAGQGLIRLEAVKAVCSDRLFYQPSNGHFNNLRCLPEIKFGRQANTLQTLFIPNMNASNPTKTVPNREIPRQAQTMS